jgi:hypothetical protein
VAVGEGRGSQEVAVLHFLTDAEKPDRIVATPRDALPDGSFVVLSHATVRPVRGG